MITLVFLTFVDLFTFVFEVLLLVRVVMSYFAGPSNGLYSTVSALTEPLLLPIRRLVPRMGTADFSPIIAFLVLQGAQYLVHVLLNAQ